GVGDAYGHGTHVEGIIAGNGKGQGYTGMAPDAKLISLRVLDETGVGGDSQVIAAIEWCIKNQARFNIRILNLSLGRLPTEAYQDDPMAQAVEHAVASGLVVVVSAGNYGKTDDGTPVVGGIETPGDTPGALTVGAVNTRGTVGRSDDLIA